MGAGGSLPGGKARPGRDADHSPPSSAEVKTERGYTSSPPKRHSWRAAGEFYFYCVLNRFQSLSYSCAMLQVSALPVARLRCFALAT
jgi:hypothetical protein